MSYTSLWPGSGVTHPHTAAQAFKKPSEGADLKMLRNYQLPWPEESDFDVSECGVEGIAE
jgi:hypothetical protein